MIKHKLIRRLLLIALLFMPLGMALPGETAAKKISDELAVGKYATLFQETSTKYHMDWRVIASIALRESRCNPHVKPLKEKAWIYYTDRHGKALHIKGHGVADIQAQAEAILGGDEFEFQTHAHGITQLVGSVLRELGYTKKYPPVTVEEQIYYTDLHLTRLIQSFTAKYNRPPNPVQIFALYNGGYRSVTEFGVQPWVEAYAVHAMLYYYKVQLMQSIYVPIQ